MNNFFAYQFEQQLDQLLAQAQLSPSIVYYILQSKAWQIYSIYLRVAQQEQHNIENTVTNTVTEKTTEAIEKSVSEKINSIQVNTNIDNEEKIEKEQSGQE